MKARYVTEQKLRAKSTSRNGVKDEEPEDRRVKLGEDLT
jgi:hypothetical protein